MDLPNKEFTPNKKIIYSKTSHCHLKCRGHLTKTRIYLATKKIPAWLSSLQPPPKTKKTSNSATTPPSIPVSLTPKPYPLQTHQSDQVPGAERKKSGQAPFSLALSSIPQPANPLLQRTVAQASCLGKRGLTMRTRAIQWAKIRVAYWSCLC